VPDILGEIVPDVGATVWECVKQWILQEFELFVSGEEWREQEGL